MKRTEVTRHPSSILAGILLLLTACAPAVASPTAAPASAAPTQVPEPTATPEPVALKLGILNFMSNSPLFIAQDGGFFAEEGLAVEFVNFGTSDRDMIPAVLQGQLDIALTTVTTATLNGIAQGANARYVADKGYANAAAGCAADAWVVRTELLNDGRLGALSGLAGTRMAFSPANPFEYVADLLLEEAGLTEQDVEILDIRDHATRVEAMSSGTLDLTAFSEPWITRAATAGVADVWRPLSDQVPGMSIGTVIFGPAMLGRDQEIGVRFMVAYLKGVERYSQGPTDRNVEIIAGYTQLAPEEIRAVCWPSFRSDGMIDAAGLLAFQQWAFDKGYLDRALTIEEVWEPVFVESARRILGP
jgi:NitT/TauT family transport system substrate-binding protein